MDSEVAPETVHHHAEHKNANLAGRLADFVLSHKIYALAAVIYLIIALVNFWPVTAHVASAVAGSGGDTYQSLWGMWFVGYSLFTLHQGIWHTMLVFWPVGAGMAYQTFNPIASVLATPFTAVSLPFAYNLIFFSGFCLSGLTMFILARYLTKNSYAAFIAGLIFAFSAFHIAQAYGHLDYASIEWIPLALYFFLRIIREDYGRNKKAIALAVTMILACFIGDVQMGVILIFLLLVIFTVYLIKKEKRVRVLSRSFYKAMLVFVVATAILGSWAWVPIVGAVLHGGSTSVTALSDVQHNELWSDDLLSFFVPSPYNGFLGGLSLSYASIYHGDISETASYLTYTAIILALLGLWKHFKENRLWLILGVVFCLLALGPVLLVAGGTTGVPLPFMLYRLIPFLNTVREPGRFSLIISIALAVMAAYGVKTLTEHKGNEAHHAAAPMINVKLLGIVTVIAILFFVESNGMPSSALSANAVTTTLSIPKAYGQLAQLSGNFSVLQLPIIPDQQSLYPNLYPGKAMYYQTVSHKPIVGGYATRENLTQELSTYQIPLAVQATSLLDYGKMIYQSPVSENYTNMTLLTLYNYGTAFVVVDKTAYNQSQFITLGSYLYALLGTPVYNDNTTTIFNSGNATAKSIYRSYVGYPVLSDWDENVTFLNGAYVEQWLPVAAGAVTVFAPYVNQSDLYNTLYHNQIYYVNSIITVVAASDGPQKLDIGLPRTASAYSLVGTANLTSQFRTYTFDVNMSSGPVGNTYFFVGESPNYPVRILNISFSRAG
jgi:hypothetical protein